MQFKAKVQTVGRGKKCKAIRVPTELEVGREYMFETVTFIPTDEKQMP